MLPEKPQSVELVGIVAAPQNGGPSSPMGGPGSILSVLIPRKWVLWISPEHPAYSDLLADELKRWPTKELRVFLSPGLPTITQQYAKAELARRGH